MGKYIEWFPGDFPANIKEKLAWEKWPYVGVSKLRKWAVFTEKHHYIDLGLPSGTLWAEENIGTGRPEGYGNYYSWGETAIKDKYLWETYRHCDGTADVLLKYNSSDQLTTLLAEDDAAAANWGSYWRMPTFDEQKELLDYCTWTHSTKNGVVGCTITGPNGNSIFLPAAGFKIDTDFESVGEIGAMWSSTLDESDNTYAYGVGYYKNQEQPGIYSTESRYIGAPIRPVYIKPTSPTDPEEPTYSDAYVTFTAELDNSTIGLKKLGTDRVIEYSTDKSVWTSMDTTITVTLPKIGDEVYIRGLLNGEGSGLHLVLFRMTGKISAAGNCNALWNYSDLNAPLKPSCGREMFSGCTALTKAPELPATTLAIYCYYHMFSECEALTEIPSLPAIQLADCCYGHMFADCISITDVSNKLPATQLAESCYEDMFAGCTSLTKAPELPATTLATGCYFRMFVNCQKLTTAPDLPAVTLAEQCYFRMFMYCSALNYIKCLATDISATNCTFGWTNGVAATGTFVKDPAMNDWQIDSPDGIPVGWTPVNNGDTPPTPTPDPDEPETTAYVTFTAQEDNSSIGLEKLSTYQTLEYSTDTTTWNPFDTTTNIPLNNGNKVYVRGVLSDKITISDFTQFKMSGKIAASGNCNAIWNYQDLNAPLKDYCGYRLFSDCSSLTTAPLLAAMTLALACYYNMFAGCTSLTTSPALPATTLVKSCYQYMFQGCTSLTKVQELPATTLAEYCYDYMFEGCSSLTTAPKLPAITLIKGCYRGMFRFCTSLTAAPELPVTTLVNDCYNAMFRGCSSLTTAPELPATTLAENCYKYMFTDCNSLHEIKCLATDISATDCTLLWVSGVAERGTFIKHPEMNDWEIDSVNGIPIGWTLKDVETPPYVTFTAQEDNSSIGLEKLSSYQTLEYSTDTNTWNPFEATTNIPLNNGDKVYVRGKLSNSNAGSNYTQFKMGGKIAASGNCNAIWDYQDLHAPLKGHCGYYMFGDCTALTKAPDLPAIAVSYYGYACMFKGCTGLTQAPEVLPATTFAQRCYYSMFSGCTALTKAPELPATTLGSGCYDSMFSGCTALTTAPALPATTLASACYSSMFKDCTALTQAPELPATTLVSSCYSGMFEGCTALAQAPELQATTLSSGCYWQMFKGCTALTQAPELPATTLVRSCYSGMFEGCTALAQAPALLATTTDDSCCQFMFRGCTSLTKAPELLATTLTDFCYDGMFYGCTALTQAPALAATTLALSCCSRMFGYCTSLTTAPELLATTLTQSCYSSMFEGCTSLTAAPELPATTLVEKCYLCMFQDCSKLNYIKCLATDISANQCLFLWVDSVSSTGTFIKHPHMTGWTTGKDGIPARWEVEDAEI